ncbi:MAG: hypothetical protein ACRD9R_15035 [Pyrinomonadaceae bacterium]
MSSAVSSLKQRTRLCGAGVCLVVLVLTFDSAAQRRPKTDRLPRVGTIKDYPATDLMTGCGNLYFHLSHQAQELGAGYVFIARGNGDDAWMNLDGRDVRLRHIKSAARPKRKTQQFFYRLGKLSVSVLLEEFKPENEQPDEDDFMLKMRIILRKGRAARTVRAVGSSDC